MKRRMISLVAAIGCAGAAEAQSLRSAYTDTDLDQCTMVAAYELGGTWACPGYRGFPLMIAEGDLRMFVSYGFGAPEEIVAGQGFPQFNHIGARLEWLLADHPERGEIPVGTILRYYLAAPDYQDPDEQVLVVTQIAPGNSCHIAYVDARANADANQMARDAAIALVGQVDCASTEPRIVGRQRPSVFW